MHHVVSTFFCSCLTKLLFFSLSPSSQVAAAWHADGRLLSYMCLEDPQQHLFDVLGFRYVKPVVDKVEPSNISGTEPPAQQVERTLEVTPDLIDRAVWPKDYTHIADPQLIYNHIADQAVAAQ